MTLESQTALAAPSTAPQETSVVAVYSTHEQAEAAVLELQRAGIDMTRLSILGRKITEEHVLGYYTAGDRMKFWGVRGAFWGSLYGVLLGSGVFLIPAIGPLVVMGPLVGWLVGALEGAAIGGSAGVLGAALAAMSIPEESAIKYEVAVKAGSFLVVARGSHDIVEHARLVLDGTGSSLLEAHRDGPTALLPGR
jgi:hypothetical protein